MSVEQKWAECELQGPDGWSTPTADELVAYRTVRTLLDIRDVVGLPPGPDADARAVLAAWRLMCDQVGLARTAAEVWRINCVLDVLDAWLDTPEDRLAARWAQIDEWLS